MQKTSLKQKLLLILLGLFLTALFLEIGLRIAGAVVFYLQERHNHLSFQPNEYRILCLGESTTALGGEDSYPSQLEEMLNSQAQQKNFTVINEGIVSTASDYILAHLDQNLDTYKPQLVIIMMGINDKAYLHNPYKNLWWENMKSHLKDLRIVKLANLLYAHISHRIKETALSAAPASHEANNEQVENFLKFVITQSLQKAQIAQAHHDEQSTRQALLQASLACVELARRYRLKGLFQEANDVLKQATTLNPNATITYQEWGELYFAQEEYSQAIKYFQAALALDPKNGDAILGLARSYYQEHDTKAFLAYAGYLQVNPQDYWGCLQLAQWLKETKHYDLAQRYLSQAIELRPDFNQAYLDMAQIYQEQGNGDKAREYFQKAAQQKIGEYLPATLVNYALLLNKISSRHIQAIVMQYPLRDIQPLEDYLGQRKGVTFVENKQNFKLAVAKEGFNYYFKDNFAYDFGHCTRQGNELIARHVQDVILSKILKGK